MVVLLSGVTVTMTEPESLAADIARRTAEDAAKDTGALPLLSHLLDDMWTQMVQRGDGKLRLPAAADRGGACLGSLEGRQAPSVCSGARRGIKTFLCGA